MFFDHPVWYSTDSFILDRRLLDIVSIFAGPSTFDWIDTRDVRSLGPRDISTFQNLKHPPTLTA